MTSSVQTKTHGQCARADCGQTWQAAIEGGGLWHKVGGYVWAECRSAFVAWSWADACPAHVEEVTAAVQQETSAYPDRWRVVTDTHDYNPRGEHIGRQRVEATGDNSDALRLF